MNNEKINFLVRGIDSRQTAITTTISALSGTPDDHRKVNALLNLLGETSGELAFLREQMLEDKKPVRKFALLCK